MKNYIFALLCFFATSCFNSCGKEVGKMVFNEPALKEMNLDFTEKEISFWVDLDVEFKGGLKAWYNIELFQNGQSVGAAQCSVFNVNIKIDSVITNWNDSHSYSYLGKMTCSVMLPKPGPTTVKANFMIESQSNDYKFKKADLVFKN